MASFKATFIEGPVFNAGFYDGPEMEAEFGEFHTVMPNPYPGPYEVTPTQQTQVLETADKSMTDNVTINPIPECYGLITWDGSKLRVS